MATGAIRSNKATRRQLTYLKALAEQTGQTFAYPKTLQEASAEIDRLKHTRPSTRTERKLIADQIATGPEDAAAVRQHEIAGPRTASRIPHPRRIPDRPARMAW